MSATRGRRPDAGGDLLFPKPKPRRPKAAELRAAKVAPVWAIEGKAERLLGAIVAGADVVHLGERAAFLLVALPHDALAALAAYDAARDDLEAEPDRCEALDDDPRTAVDGHFCVYPIDDDAEHSLGWSAGARQTGGLLRAGIEASAGEAEDGDPAEIDDEDLGAGEDELAMPASHSTIAEAKVPFFPGAHYTAEAGVFLMGDPEKPSTMIRCRRVVSRDGRAILMVPIGSATEKALDLAPPADGS